MSIGAEGDHAGCPTIIPRQAVLQASARSGLTCIVTYQIAKVGLLMVVDLGVLVPANRRIGLGA